MIYGEKIILDFEQDEPISIELGSSKLFKISDCQSLIVITEDEAKKLMNIFQKHFKQ